MSQKKDKPLIFQDTQVYKNEHISHVINNNFTQNIWNTNKINQNLNYIIQNNVNALNIINNYTTTTLNKQISISLLELKMMKKVLEVKKVIKIIKMIKMIKIIMITKMMMVMIN